MYVINVNSKLFITYLSKCVKKGGWHRNIPRDQIVILIPPAKKPYNFFAGLNYYAVFVRKKEGIKNPDKPVHTAGNNAGNGAVNDLLLEFIFLEQGVMVHGQ